MKSSLLIIGLLAFPAWLTAQVYKWVDAEGRVHYSDDPPSAGASERIELSPGPSPSAIQRAQTDLALLLEQQERARAALREARRVTVTENSANAEADALREQACAADRRQLVILETRRPVYRDAEGALGVLWAEGTRPNIYQGERTYLDETERRALLARARASITTNCRDPDDPNALAVAEAEWLRAEDCKAVVAQLREMRAPESRTAASVIARKQEEADRYCR